MIGAILCGGQSSRMGSDKGLIKIENTTWAQYAADKLLSIGIPVAMSINKSQSEIYHSNFNNIPLIEDDPEIHVKGPLHGLLSIHKHYAGEDIFFLACDLPLMNNSILQALANFYLLNKSMSHIFINDDKPEPLCGIYTSEALSTINNMLQSNRLKKYSLKYALEQVPVLYHPLEDNQKRFFVNVNDPHALNNL